MSFKRRRWIDVWSILALVLLAGYGYVVYLAKHPNVSEAYRAYYIDRTSNLSPKMLEARLETLPALTPGQVYPHDASEILLLGWDTAEPEHTWTLGESAQIILTLPRLKPQQAREFTLILRGMYLTGVQRIIARVQNAGGLQKIIDGTYRDGEDMVITFEVPPGAEQLVTLALELPDAQVPDNGDRRVLGFALKSLELAKPAFNQ